MAESSCKPAARRMKCAHSSTPSATVSSARSSAPRMSTKSRRCKTRAASRSRFEKLSARAARGNFQGMSTITEIREAIEKLSLEERAELLAELHNWEDDEWDRQMRADAAAGRFDAMNAK